MISIKLCELSAAALVMDIWTICELCIDCSKHNYSHVKYNVIDN